MEAIAIPPCAVVCRDDHLCEVADNLAQQLHDATEVNTIDRGEHIIEDDDHLLGFPSLGDGEPDAESERIEVGFAVVGLWRNVGMASKRRILFDRSPLVGVHC